MQNIRFELGEHRHVKLLIHAVDDAPFVIRRAHWELIWGGNTEMSGECEIDGHIIDMFIAPQKRTTYQLLVQYEIADEVLVEQVGVVVM